MYVKRCGFYIQDNQLVRKDVWINWDMDTRKEDRYVYIGKIKDALGLELNPIVDTTSVSPNYLGKKLNAYWNKIDGESCIKVYNGWKEKCDPDELIPGVFEYIYYTAINDANVRFIKTVKCFTNMFFNPDRQKTCEAMACALLKLLIGQNKLDYVQDVEQLVYWIYVNTNSMRIIQAGDKPEEQKIMVESSFDKSEFKDIEHDEDDFELPFA